MNNSELVSLGIRLETQADMLRELANGHVLVYDDSDAEGVVYLDSAGRLMVDGCAANNLILNEGNIRRGLWTVCRRKSWVEMLATDNPYLCWVSTDEPEYPIRLRLIVSFAAGVNNPYRDNEDRWWAKAEPLTDKEINQYLRGLVTVGKNL